MIITSEGSLANEISREETNILNKTDIELWKTLQNITCENNSIVYNSWNILQKEVNENNITIESFFFPNIIVFILLAEMLWL